MEYLCLELADTEGPWQCPDIDRPITVAVVRTTTARAVYPTTTPTTWLTIHVSSTYRRSVKLKILLKFYQILKHINVFSTLTLLVGWQEGQLKIKGWVSPKFSVPLAMKLYVGPPNILEVQEHAQGSLPPCRDQWGSYLTTTTETKRVEFLFVCLSVTLLNN